MSGQLQGTLSPVERVPVLRYAFVLLMGVIATIPLSLSWNEAGASTSVLQNRIFLMGTALVVAVVAVTLALTPWWEKVGAWLIAAHLVIMGLYLGLAIATTDWTAWQMRGWWQFWWTPPLMSGQIQQVLRLRRHLS